MVVAYSTLPANTTPFTEYFSSTVGKESQIILQDKIILRNKREKIELGYSLNEYRLLSKSFAEWEQRDTPAINFIQNIWQTPHLFYTIPSIQYYSNPLPPDPNNSDIYNNYMAAPNPLAATYKPDTQNYDDLVKNDYQEFYSFLDWSNNVKALIDNVCVISIGKIEQAPTGTYTNTGKCFNYDDVGNETDAYNCVANSNTNPSTGYTVDELEAISNSIILYPNPTTASSQYNVTISWSGVALNKIYNLQVYSSAGMSVYNYNPITGINTTSFNLQSQLPGTFVANFVLNTGQIVSKNILKW